MLYRTMPHIKEKVSVLGFGAMRLPTKPDGSIDQPTVNAMIRRGIEGGINYVDTAWPYHGGHGEEAVGQALSGGLREKVLLATKMPIWLMTSQADMERTLDEQLRKLKTDHLDVYLIHSLTTARWKKAVSLDALGFMERAREAGKIRYIGFSFHDGLKLFKEIVDFYPWDLCQIQYNLLDTDFQAGTEGLQYAASRGIGVVVMEPVKGGVLALPIEGDLVPIAERANYQKKNLADLALRWVWNQPEVGLVLSGMSSPQQLEENLASAERGFVGNLSEAEMKMVGEVRNFLRSRIRAACTGCAYCMPCPQNVDIPQCFRSLNDGALSGNWETAKMQYGYLLGPKGLSGGLGASACIECGQCETKCPQHLPIRELLKEVKKIFEG